MTFANGPVGGMHLREFTVNSPVIGGKAQTAPDPLLPSQRELDASQRSIPEYTVEPGSFSDSSPVLDTRTVLPLPIPGPETVLVIVLSSVPRELGVTLSASRQPCVGYTSGDICYLNRAVFCHISITR